MIVSNSTKLITNAVLSFLKLNPFQMISRRLQGLGIWERPLGSSRSAGLEQWSSPTARQAPALHGTHSPSLPPLTSLHHCAVQLPSPPKLTSVHTTLHVAGSTPCESGYRLWEQHQGCFAYEALFIRPPPGWGVPWHTVGGGGGVCRPAAFSHPFSAPCNCLVFARPILAINGIFAISVDLHMTRLFFVQTLPGQKGAWPGGKLLYIHRNTFIKCVPVQFQGCSFCLLLYTLYQQVWNGDQGTSGAQISSKLSKQSCSGQISSKLCLDFCLSKY